MIVGPVDDAYLLLDRRRAFRHMMGLRADLSGYRHDPKRQHPNHHDRRKGDRQRSLVAIVDQAFVVEAGTLKISRHCRISLPAAISASGRARDWLEKTEDWQVKTGRGAQSLLSGHQHVH